MHAQVYVCICIYTYMCTYIFLYIFIGSSALYLRLFPDLNVEPVSCSGLFTMRILGFAELFACLKGLSESVQALFIRIEAVMLLTSMILK